MKTIAVLSLIALSVAAQTALAQNLSYNPGLPSTLEEKVAAPAGGDAAPRAAASTAGLAPYAGTYVGVVVYYDISDGVGDWEVVFEKNGTIRLSDKYQAKYPGANVSGSFSKNGTFTYTNQNSSGVTFVTTGKINRKLEKLTATFTSNSAGTGVIVCHKM